VTALAPGTVIDGTPEEVAEVLRGAPEGTVVSDRRGLPWFRANDWILHVEFDIDDMVEFAPFTVLRWGRELPPPVDVAAVVLKAVVQDRLSIAGVLGDIVGADAVTNLWSAAEVDRRNRAAGGDPA
jgi:hypothetical protein